MKAETFDKGKLESSVDMSMYLTDTDSYIGMELHGEDGENIDFMVLDMAEKEMLSLINTEGQKMGMLISTDQNTEAAENPETIPEVNFRKTGRSEEISGFSCEEYAVEYENDDDYDLFFWMTTETESDWVESMSNISALAPQASVNNNLPVNYPEGSVIRINSISKDETEENIITILELNNNTNHKVSTSGYSFIEMPSQPGY